MDDSQTDCLTERMENLSDVLVDRVLQFAQLVRSHGIPVTSGRVIDAQRSLRYIDLGRRDDFYHAVRANLIARPDDIAPFDALFDRFWRVTPDVEPETEEPSPPQVGRPAEGRSAADSLGPPHTGEGSRWAGDDEDVD